ncbi:MAG: SDR family oxidoreductase [Fuerstiella sp.]|nr:SDR family oxidoreductase [Fuerstiella sp.]
MYQDTLFDEKIALVTGGRSGIGYSIAKMYLQLGGQVIVASRKQTELEAAAKELSEFGSCCWHCCDIRDVDHVTSLAQRIQDEYGRLDILVNNAGGQFASPAESISSNGWSAVINNNLNGTFYVSRQMAKTFFIPQKAGVIVNIIANMFRGFPGMAHTGAARAGVENLTRTLAQEWAEYNIRINAIAPGIIESSGLDTYPEPIRASFEESRGANLMKRFGTPEDVANAAMFYSSPLSSYISGTTLYVDGMEHLAGHNMRLLTTIREMLNTDQ